MTRSESLYTRAATLLPGGVNSPVRAFRAVGGTPVFFERAAGAHVWGADGERYIDYIGSWGPAIVGHAHPDVVAAVAAAAARGLSFGAPCAAEAELAARVVEHVPAVEKLRLVSSGTEACLSAIRLARGATGRAAILKFEGCYHGHGDSFLVKAGSGALTLSTPDSAGVPAALAALTLTAAYNDTAEVEALFAARGHDIAAVIVEPVAGNMNLILPQPGFLETLRRLCDAYGAVLIFDEVMTGFRVALGGAQQRYAIRPDLTCFGKVIGGGMPVGAYGGKRELMDLVAPLGPVYQAGTLSGNPVAMAAGITTLDLIARPGFHAELEAKAQALMDGLATAAAEYDVSFATAVAGGMFGFFFTAGPVTSYAQARAVDLARFKRFFHAMLRRGVYLAPSAFEAGFISIAHSEADITATVDAARMSLAEITTGP